MILFLINSKSESAKKFLVVSFFTATFFATTFLAAGFFATAFLVVGFFATTFENPAYKELYFSIEDTLFPIMIKYADKIDKLTNEQIDIIDEYLESCYECSLSVREKIKSFLKTRRVIVSKCVDNQTCYNNVNNRILIS